MRPSPISLDAFAQPEKFFFPPKAYTSAAFHEFELDAVWRSQWVAVGRVEEIPNVGDYSTISIGPEPLIVVRDSAEEILALSAVCRHRAMIVAEGAGNCKGRFVCPYHAWTYDRRGNLIGAPQMPSEFDRRSAGLARVPQVAARRFGHRAAWRCLARRCVTALTARTLTEWRPKPRP